MKKQNIVIVAAIALVLVLAVGYALFSETLTINGTATAQANFDVEFTSIGTVTSAGYTHVVTDPTHELATISADKNAVVVRVNKLDYPGAYVEIPITITNVGTLNATLKAINVTGWDATSTPIKVSYLYDGKVFSELSEAQKEIAVNGTKVITVRVEWLADDNTETAEPENLENAQFTITLDYEQSATQAN